MKIFSITRQDLSCYVFCFVVWRFFILHLFTQQSWKGQIVEWLFILTNGFFARDIISHSTKRFLIICVFLIILELPLNKNDFCTLKT